MLPLLNNDTKKCNTTFINKHLFSFPN